MAKNLKLNIKNTQIAQAISLGGLKEKLAKKNEEQELKKKPSKAKGSLKDSIVEPEETSKDEAPRIKARSKSAFAEPHGEHGHKDSSEEGSHFSDEESDEDVHPETEELPPHEEIASHEDSEVEKELMEKKSSTETVLTDSISKTITHPIEEKTERPPAAKSEPVPAEKTAPVKEPIETPRERPLIRESLYKPKHVPLPPRENAAPMEKLGPTGRHIKDYIKPKPIPPKPALLPVRDVRDGKEVRKDIRPGAQKPTAAHISEKPQDKGDREKVRDKTKAKEPETGVAKTFDEESERRLAKSPKQKEFKDIKPTRRVEPSRQFDARDRHGLRASDEDQNEWRRRKAKAAKAIKYEDPTIRPTTLKVRLPISIKDLASEMKLKASQLIAKLFLQGLIVTLNDYLEDETAIQLLGHEFGCQISIDTSEQKRIQITDKTIKEELAGTPQEELLLRPPVVAFMGHVDHGKTSLIDAIRKSNRAAGEAGAITQHIGAFRCSTPVGDIAILDTPGHEAFSAMRARGADVTDIVVLVVAGDEGLRQQSIEAIQHAKAANVIIVVAINKSDKPNFNPETVYRQLADIELLPEAWGGQTITVNCSAVTGQGIPELLEMLALQAEILELVANPHSRARGTVLESEMHKGLGSVATVLIQNGTLKRGDALVFGQHWGRVKTMHDEHGKELQEAGPSTPVEITGLSGLPEAGQEFIVVKSEKEAREISEVRSEGARQTHLVLQQKKKTTVESLLQHSTATGRKTLNVIIRADVQGSLEALKSALLKIESDKVDLNIIFTGVGEVSESDVQLAAASKAVILGFHTQVESHAEKLISQLSVHVLSHDIIYHAIDQIKDLMGGLLDKIAIETEKGKALVLATFKSSHSGIIAGCQITEGSVHRNHQVRVKRGQEVVWKGSISSIKRVKEDVREVQKGFECGIILNNFPDIKEGDIIESYEITYTTQSL